MMRRAQRGYVEGEIERSLRRWVLVVGLLSLLAGAVSATPEEIEWVLTDSECSDEGPSVKISCGNYGVFYLFTHEAPAGCEDIVSGDHNPRNYPLPPEIEGFPDVPWEGEPTQTFGAGLGDPPVESSDSLRVSVVDFNSTHGTSAWWLAGAVGGDPVTAELSYIDDPSYEAFGPVGDFHLLASVCSLLEEVEVDGRESPAVVNLSLGREPQEDEPPSLKRCRRELDNLLCQLQGVIERLRGYGSHFLAASGNHTHELIPAAFEGVASTGALDLTHMLNDRLVERAWETAEEASALFPGNGLCLRGGFAAPGGSSYSSAIFSGWLAAALVKKPYLDPLDGQRWTPLWADGLGCFVLAVGDEPVTRCSPAIDDLVDQLTGPASESCWDVGGTRIESVGPLPPKVLPPNVQTFDEWADLHPTPASDPCIPCSGGLSQTLGFTTDIAINMSESPALPGEYFLKEVYVRFGDDFYPTGLVPGIGSVIEKIEDGDLDYLILPGWLPLVDTSESASLFYVISADEQADCVQSPSSCFWRSTQILWLTSGW